jgi:hypothetical protein
LAVHRVSVLALVRPESDLPQTSNIRHDYGGLRWIEVVTPLES